MERCRMRRVEVDRGEEGERQIVALSFWRMSLPSRGTRQEGIIGTSGGRETHPGYR